MSSHKLVFVATNSGDRENACKALKDAVYSFRFVHVHRRKLPKNNTTVFKNSTLGIIKNSITAKVK